MNILKSKWGQWAIATALGVPAVMMVAATSALAADYYGAIAYSESTGSHGYSYDYGTQFDAESRAIGECEAYARSGDCRVLVWFKNACGALATAPNGAYGTGWGINRSIAEQYAVETCSAYGQGCAPVRWVCTSRDPQSR